MTPERWQQLKSVLETVMETSPTKREFSLKEACEGDDELRREVESLLAFEDSENKLFDESAFSAVIKDFTTEAGDNFVGMQIGRYRILRELGAGGMGIVFLAERADGEFEQQVAVKILRRSFFNSSAGRKFQKERQILARLKHPFIAQLLDGGATVENTPFLVMEYVEGASITQYSEEKNLSLAEKLDLFRKVCEAVSFAHRNLIVHRDLKPDNILINKEGVPKLLDFGIAKLMSENDIKATVTRFQALTPEYASPEQIFGGSITTATDIYSLGVVLYELVTGQKPFAVEETTTERMLRAIRQNDPIKPSQALTGKEAEKKTGEEKERHKDNEKIARGKTFSISTHRFFSASQLKGDLDNIILKALKKEPERRYQSVELFSEDIRRHLAGLPVTARADTFVYRAEKFIKRNTLAVVAVLLAFVSLLGGLLVSNYQRQIANAERAKAERRFADVRALANSFMFEINEKIDESPIKARELLVRHAVEYLDKLAAEAESDVTLQRELATAYEKIGDVQSEIFKPGLGNSQGAFESQHKALKMREAIYERDNQNVESGLDLAQSYIKVGNASAMTGNTSNALENYRKAVAINENLLKIEPENARLRENTSRSYAMLGQGILRSGSISEALNYYEKAIATIKPAIEKNPGNLQIERNLSIYYSYAGYAKMEMGAKQDALSFFQNALAIEEKVLAANPENTHFRANLAIAELWVGVAFRELGKTEDSIFHLQQALKIQKEIFDADRANFGERNGLADCYLELGWTLALNKNYDRSVKAYQTAIDHYEAVAKADPRNIAARRQIIFTERNLADVFLARGETEKAIDIYQKSLSALKDIAASDPNNTDYKHDIAACYIQIGEVFVQKQDKTAALSNFKAALPILESLINASPENAKRRSDWEKTKKHIENL